MCIAQSSMLRPDRALVQFFFMSPLLAWTNALYRCSVMLFSWCIAHCWSCYPPIKSKSWVGHIQQDVLRALTPARKSCKGWGMVSNLTAHKSWVLPASLFPVFLLSIPLGLWCRSSSCRASAASWRRSWRASREMPMCSGVRLRTSWRSACGWLYASSSWSMRAKSVPCSNLHSCTQKHHHHQQQQQRNRVSTYDANSAAVLTITAAITNITNHHSNAKNDKTMSNNDY